MINYDDILYDYAFSIKGMRNGQSESTKLFFASDYDKLELNDFIFEEQKEQCLIKMEYESLNKIDTLLILGNCLGT